MKTIEKLPQRLVSVKEFARIMDISIWTARDWAYCGRLSSNKVGGKLMIPVSEIDRLCEETFRPAVSA